MVFFKLILVFVVMIVLVRFKLHISFALFLGAIFHGILYKMDAGSIFVSLIDSSSDTKTIFLALAIIFLIIFGYVLKKIERLSDLIKSIQALVSNNRFIVAVLPAIIGLLPMPGGAMVSAPMVNEIGGRLNMSAELKTVTNYWFRHIWEYMFPLYPGLIIATAILDIQMSTLIMYIFPLTIIMTLAGAFFILRQVPGVKNDTSMNNKKENLIILYHALWPILLILFLYFIIRLEFVLSILLSLIAVFVFNKVKPKKALEYTIKGFPVRITFLVFAMKFFYLIIERSNAVQLLSVEMEVNHIPSYLIVGLLPFIAALITGINQAFVAIAFPILTNLIKPDGVLDPALLTLAYGLGFIGIILSPVHLCLVLTKDYFGANFAKVYKMMIKPVVVLILAVFIMYYLYL